MKKATDLEQLWSENIRLKSRLTAARGELRIHKAVTGDFTRVVNDAFVRTEQLASQVQVQKSILTLVGIRSQFGGKLDIDFEHLTNALGPVQALELAEVILEKFGDVTDIASHKHGKITVGR